VKKINEVNELTMKEDQIFVDQFLKAKNGMIEIIVDSKIVNESYSFDAHNVIKYRY
jgi:hypothetical protein